MKQLMKSVIVLLCCLFFASCSQAQDFFKAGVRLGLSSSSIKVDDVVDAVRGDTTATEFITDRARIGGHFGLWARVKLGGLHVQPELLYTALSGDVAIRDIVRNQPRETIERFNFSRVDLNLLAGANAGPLRLQVGPVASWMVSNAEDVRDFKQNYNKYTMGGLIGIGFDISRIGIDVRYESNLSKLGDSVTFRGKTYTLDKRANQIVASLAFRF